MNNVLESSLCLTIKKAHVVRHDLLLLTTLNLLFTRSNQYKYLWIDFTFNLLNVIETFVLIQKDSVAISLQKSWLVPYPYLWKRNLSCSEIKDIVLNGVQSKQRLPTEKGGDSVTCLCVWLWVLAVSLLVRFQFLILGTHQGTVESIHTTQITSYSIREEIFQNQMQINMVGGN